MKKDNQSSRVGIVVLLTFVLIGMKLGGITDWPWWLVLFPLALHVGISLLLTLLNFAINQEYKQ